MDMDRAYANGAFIAGGDAWPARWAAQAAAFRTGMGPRATLGLACGPKERQRLDLFRPLGAARGTVVFLHGGYWMAFDRSSWSHLAAGALARGWAVAIPSYTLAPEARISAITAEIAAALAAVAAQTPGPVVVTGHSAGGHLAARMACAGVLDAGRNWKPQALRLGLSIGHDQHADMIAIFDRRQFGTLVVEAINGRLLACLQHDLVALTLSRFVFDKAQRGQSSR
jgi:hypothetical protein